MARSGALAPMYPVALYDALRVKSREDAVVRNQVIHLALGVLADGTRDIEGLWIEAAGLGDAGRLPAVLHGGRVRAVQGPTDTQLWAGLAFFALCALVGTTNVLQKLRRQRFQATRVEVVEGVPIRAGGSYTLTLGIGTTVVAGAFLVSPGPWLAKACAAVMGAAGLWLLGVVATGKLRQRFLQFDPAGLTVAGSGFQYGIVRDNIAGLAEFEIAGVTCVGIALADEDAVPVTPAARTAKARKRFDRNRRTMGAHVVLAPMHFGLDSGVLAAAIATRVDDHRRRRAAMRDRSRGHWGP